MQEKTWDKKGGNKARKKPPIKQDKKDKTENKNKITTANNITIAQSSSQLYHHVETVLVQVFLIWQGTVEPEGLHPV